MRNLPNAQTLSDAVRHVTESNLSDGYPPNRFIGATQDGTSPELLAVCMRLINKDEILADIERALKKVPTLLTLEDFVSRRGSAWGFDDTTVEKARVRAEYFDNIAGGTRYS